MNNALVIAVKKTVFRTYSGQLAAMVTVSSGKIELYRIEADGREMFERYVTTNDPYFYVASKPASELARVNGRLSRKAG